MKKKKNTLLFEKEKQGLTFDTFATATAYNTARWMGVGVYLSLFRHRRRSNAL